ncbi:MAG: OsmC family protein [Gemmatimonadota bacterium]|nr:OsmC family protein [Gemmatimonadota bacterium]MDH5804416.1 OsmC family protein [Gemmatimonadota bacterium]
MLGTLNGALEVREIVLPPENIQAHVEGINEIRDGLPVLTEVKVSYRLVIPAQTRDKVERALEKHQAKCPTAQTLKGAVDVSWTAEITEQ